jgi:hypothetical protein
VPTTGPREPGEFLSDLSFTQIQNGWGPVERDRSNGDSAAGDGNTITLNGVRYSKGLGVHASSEVRYNLAGNYTTFLADIGLDDEMDPQGLVGSIVFQVWADGVKLYDSSECGGAMNTASATRKVCVNVTSKLELRLVVTDGGDDNWFDHADWAGARLIRTLSP